MRIVRTYLPLFCSNVWFFGERNRVKYPWKVYKQIRFVIFYMEWKIRPQPYFQSYVVDTTGFEDRNYTNVNAHAGASVVWDLITAESGKHHWLQEGFATYYALRQNEKFMEMIIFTKLYETAQQIKYVQNGYNSGFEWKSKFFKFYQKGVWGLFVLHEAIGDKAFKKQYVVTW
jgi:aminopeptidase N